MKERHVPINLWDDKDKPREKLIKLGPQNLSNAELMALIIRSGSREESAVDLSKNILSNYKNDLNLISSLTHHDLMKNKGIGEVKAISIVAALELSERKKRIIKSNNYKISSSEDAYNCFAEEINNLNHEEFWILMLNRANKIIRLEQISKGGIHGTVVDPKIVFKKALDYRACGIILGHNHPSGNIEPSRQDKELTYKLKEGAKLIDIVVFDHIIVGDQSYYSFADNNLI